MAIVNTLQVVLDAKTQKFQSGMKKASGSVKSFAKNNKTMGDVLGNAKKALLGMNPAVALVATAVIGAAAGIAKLTISSAKMAEQLQKDAIRLGTTTEALSQLSFAAEQSGASADNIRVSLLKLNQATGEALTGNKEYADSFDLVNISMEELAALPADEKLRKIADGLNAIDNPAKRSAVGIRLLGRQFNQLIPLLNEGSEGIQALQDEADSLGRTISTEFANKSAEFIDNTNRLKSISTGLGQTIAVEVLPAINSMLETMIELGKKALPVVRDVVFSLAFEFRRVGAFVGILVEKIKDLLPGVEANQEALDRLNATVAQSKEEYAGLREELEATAEAEREAALAAEAAASAEADRLAALQEIQQQMEAINVLMADGEIDFEPTAEELKEIEQIAETDMPAAFDAGFSSIQLAASALFDGMAAQAQSFLQKTATLASALGDVLVDSATEGKKAFADFFKALLKQILKAIIRAIILRAILGAFGLGGAGFLKDVGKLLVSESIGGGGGGGGGAPPVASQVIGSGNGTGTPQLDIPSSDVSQSLFRPSVTVIVSEPSPLTQVQFVTDIVEPRLQQMQQELNTEEL